MINDISHITNYILFEIEQWVKRAEIEEGIRDLMNVKYGRIPYLDAIIENRYKRNSIKEYFILLKHEFEIRWLRVETLMIKIGTHFIEIKIYLLISLDTITNLNTLSTSKTCEKNMCS